MNFTQLPISRMIALGTLMFIAGCADHKLVADVSATWSIPNRELNHSDALNLIVESFDDTYSYPTDTADIAVEIHTPDILEFRITMSDALLVEYRERLETTEYTEGFEDPQITDFPAWHIYNILGFTENTGDITIRYRIFVPEDFDGYDSITNDARGSIAVNAIMLSTALGVPIDIEFHVPQISKDEENDD